MEYHREFNLQIAHFNNARAYELYENIAREGESPFRSVTLMRELLKLIHGHNLKIVVELEGYTYKEIKGDDWIGVGFLVDDAELEKIVMEWDNTNLSVLPEFFGKGKRATTEEIADTLCSKIFYKWIHLASVQVSVWETPLISAVSRRGRSVAY